MKTIATETAAVTVGATCRQADANFVITVTGVLVVPRVAQILVKSNAIIILSSMIAVLTECVAWHAIKTLENAIHVKTGFGEATVTQLVSQ